MSTSRIILITLQVLTRSQSYLSEAIICFRIKLHDAQVSVMCPAMMRVIERIAAVCISAQYAVSDKAVLKRFLNACRIHSSVHPLTHLQSAFDWIISLGRLHFPR